ncbi:MAG: hypothetical protein IJW67_04575 [Blautia sp.]|nr:hypothetical protein [Blautia sp.]
MADTTKNKNKTKRKTTAARRKRQNGKEMQELTPEQEKRLQQRKKREAFRNRMIIAVVAAVILIALILFVWKRTYHSYKVVLASEQEDVVSTNYVSMGGKILRYSPTEASLMDRRMRASWTESYSMSNPVADVNGNSAVIADIDGTSFAIFNKNGKTGEVTTSYSIVKARISENGLAAVILDAGDDTWINFYASDGSLIAENQTKVDDPGFPLDMAVSDNGSILMVAYQFVDGGDTTSYVAFYNFSEVGQNEDDRIVSGYTYEGTVIPQVQFLSAGKYVALRDNGFTLYNGKQIPKEKKSVEVENEIISTFYDENLIGLVFKNSDDTDKLYTMDVYSTDGKLKFSRSFNIPYTSVKMSDNAILLYNSSQICIMNDKGEERFNSTIDGTVRNFFKIGWNRYMLILDNGINIIKLA